MSLSLPRLLAFAGSAYAQQSVKLRPFPKLRFGIGAEPTAGGGYLAGAPYNTRTAVIARHHQRMATLDQLQELLVQLKAARERLRGSMTWKTALS